MFTKQNSQDSIEVRVQDENVWLTQDGIARLFDKGRSTIAEHLQSVFKEGELSETSVCRNFRQAAADGKTYNTKFYNLDAIISVGYRVVQDKLFKSDFDKFLSEAKAIEETHAGI